MVATKRRSGRLTGWAPPDVAAAAIILIALTAAGYRAATQSITIDEAITYNIFICQPVHWMMTMYSTNHHVLHSMVAKVATWILGVNEFALRLPALIGGAMFMVCIYRIARRLTGPTWWAPLALAAATLSPYTLDYIAISRGYGLAMGLYAWGLYRMVCLLGPDRQPQIDQTPQPAVPTNRWLVITGVIFGLAGAAHLTYLVPIFFTVIICAIARVTTMKLRRPQRAGRMIGIIGLITALTTGLIMAGPMGPWATRNFGNFVTGTTHPAAVVSKFLAANFDHHLNGATSLSEPIILVAFGLVMMVLLFLLISLGVVAWRAHYPWAKPARGQAGFGEADRSGAVSARLRVSVAVAAIGLMVLLPNFIGPWLTGSHYPAPRQLTYWPALLSLGLAGFGALAWRAGHRLARPAGAVAAALLVWLAGWFVGQLNVGGYHGFRGNQSTRAMIEQIRRLNGSIGPQPIRIGGDWRVASAAMFYRNRDMPDRLSQFDRVSYDQCSPERCNEMDYLLLSAAAPIDVRPLGFVTVFEDPIGNRLAVSTRLLTRADRATSPTEATADANR